MILWPYFGALFIAAPWKRWRLRIPVMIGTAALAVFSRTPWSAVAGYPDKPIRFIVPVSPGGGSDLLARTIGIKLSEILGQSVIVDNRPGASGNIGAEIVAKSSPDGYTIVIETTVLITAPMLYRAVPFDPSKDFAPITLAARVPHVLVVNPKLQATSLMRVHCPGSIAACCIELFLCWKGQSNPSRRGVVQESSPSGYCTCAICRRRAGECRCNRRSSRLNIWQHHGSVATYKSWEAKSARHHEC